MHPGGVSYTNSPNCDMILSPVSLSQQHSECRLPGLLSMVSAPRAQAQLPGQEVRLSQSGRDSLDSLHLLLACKLTEGQHLRLHSDHKGQWRISEISLELAQLSE